MKTLKKSLTQLRDTQILTRLQLKKVVGGLDDESLGCTTKCDVWEGGAGGGMTIKDCLYVAGQSGLPGFCECPSTTNTCK